MTAAFLAAWWTQGLVVAAILAATAALLQWIARDSVPVRAIWGVALLGATLLTFASPFRLRDTGAAAQPPLPGTPVAAAAPDAAPPFELRRITDRVAATVRRAIEAPVEFAAASAAGVPTSAARAFLAAWVLASAALLALLIGSHRRLRRALRDAPVRVIAGMSVRVTRAIGPAVVGVRDPVVAVPQWMLSLDEHDQALVVRHERSHVAARDPMLLICGVGLAALQPWNPVIWLIVSRLRLAIELDCDRRLLRGGIAPRAYGDLLISLAGAAPPALRPAVLHPMFSHHTSQLAQRIIAMTERPVRLITARRLAAVALAALAFVAACEARLPTDVEVAAMDAAMVERQVVGTLVPDASRAIWYVDGVQLSAEEAKRIPAHRVASIEVTKGVGSEIRVTTGELRRDSTSVVIETPLVRLRTAGATKDFTGVVVIDGVVVESGRLSEIPRDRIESVSVFKGASAVRLYGPNAVNGAIVIKTKPIH